MMINPSIEQLTKGKKMNRYMLVIAAAKTAKSITEDYQDQRMQAEEQIKKLGIDKTNSQLTLDAFIDPVLAEDKAVETAVLRLKEGGYYEIYNAKGEKIG